ncbi:MAG TPA: helix-turn-helix transcriptional regulator [Allosphingosinicella sp.]
MAERLRLLLIEARTASGLTQKELGARMDRPQSFVSNYERGAGRIDAADFILVAKALGLDPKNLVARVE